MKSRVAPSSVRNVIRDLRSTAKDRNTPALATSLMTEAADTLTIMLGDVRAASRKGADGENWAPAIAYAAGYIATDRDEPMIASEILRNAGFLTAADLRKGGAASHDVKNCAPAFKQIRKIEKRK